MFGFLHQVFKLAKIFDTKKLVFAWDSKKSYRRQADPEYKANRKLEELTQEQQQEKLIFYSQVNELRRRIIPALGFKNSFICTGLEADDVIANLVLGGCNGSVVISSDNDLWQLLEHCSLYSIRTRKKFTRDIFFNLYGIEPEQWAMIKQIAGCSGDNVVGIKGVGEATAIKYILGEKLKSGKLQQRIDSPESQEIIKKNERLVKLPFEVKHLELSHKEKFSLDTWIDVFTRYDFRSFMDRGYLKDLKRAFELR